MSAFNVLEHELVPEHHLLSREEEEEVLKTLGVTKSQLPKIRKSDPVLVVLEQIHGPIEPGRVIKIIRSSPTAGIAVAYRVVAVD